MKRENYIITVKSIYIRDAEMFCPESMTEQEILNLDDIDIFQSCEFERIKKGTSENCRIFQDTSLFFRSNSCKKRFGR